MAWVKFVSDFDWSPRHGVDIAYKKGMVQFVTRRCCKKAIELDLAVKSEKPKGDDK